MNQEKVRLDRWLWATRFYKTRSLASSAIKRGRIKINAQNGKPAKLISVGDSVRIRKAQLIYDIVVDGLGEKRVGAKIAQTLYTETKNSIQLRETRMAEIIANRKNMVDGRPNKKNRRIQQAIKRHIL